MYRSPQITSYAQADLIDLMGPVETQYRPPPPPPPPCCDILNASVEPPTFFLGKDDIDLCLDVTACDDLQSVRVTLFDSNGRPLTSDTFSASQGASGGGMWCTNFEFGFVPDPGQYEISIVATDANGCSSDPIRVGFEVVN